MAKIDSHAAAAVEDSLRDLGLSEFQQADSRARTALPMVFGWTKTRYLISTLIVGWMFWDTSAAVAAALAWLILVIEVQGIFVADVWFRVFKPDLGR